MKSLKFASALLALGIASQAQATRYAYCDVQGGKEGDLFVYYQSGIIEIAEEDDAAFNLKYGPFGQGFLKYVQANFSPNSPHVDCEAASTLKDAKEQANYDITGGVSKKTGWLGGRPAAVDRNDPKPHRDDELILTRPGETVTVDTRKRTNSAPAKQQWEVDYDRKMVAYEQELARQKAEFERAEADRQRKIADSVERARKARAEWERAVAACKAGDHAACSGATQQ